MMKIDIFFWILFLDVVFWILFLDIGFGYCFWIILWRVDERVDERGVRRRRVGWRVEKAEGRESGGRERMRKECKIYFVL